jgi:hypothetical protein
MMIDSNAERRALKQLEKGPCLLRWQLAQSLLRRGLIEEVKIEGDARTYYRLKK